MTDATACPACGSANEPGRKFCGECGASLAQTCSSCGTANAPDTKYCGECGSRLASPGASEPPAATAERRLVSVLFADLVGFTTASEARDAEDTRELLSRYFDTARAIVERYGGTVEKFIGDAVMAVWGAPVAREDDAERAVRAALELVGAIPGLDSTLAARSGVLTGEAAVTVGAEGQGMVAGDLVNSASRIQSIAEPGTVLVGDATRRASEAAIAYEDAGEHELKGKAERVTLSRALRVVASRGGGGRSAGLEAPFVGRDRELRLVKDLFHAAAEERTPHLVSVVGVAGIGKSRLAWEFEKYVDGVVDTVYWHRGRCLAYGEGVAYWALAEMMRSRSGIVETDGESAALAKLQATVAEHVPDSSEREWVEPRLQHLLGLAERATAEREDLFSAWRLFFERLAEKRTVVLLFEDLHWADAGLLAFVEHLLDWSRNHPILVLVLARPELAERHPAFPGPTRNSTTVALDPLPSDAMDELLLGLVPGLPDETRSAIRERADGIPLYAVETVRMLLDRGLLEPADNEYRLTGSVDTMDVPETLHALIAARLDGLDPAERRLLQQASVLGKTFTVRGLAALSGLDPSDIDVSLGPLARKELLSLDTDPRSPERGQYGFVQALVQRIAYETLARAERRSLHLAAGAFLAEHAGIDPDELAEVIAAHYRDALAASPTADDARAVRSQAIEWLVRAGERSASLAATHDARRAFDDAATLADDPLERAPLLERGGELAYAGDELDLSRQRLEESRSLYLQAGRTHDAARAAVPLSRTLWSLGRLDEALELAEPALAILSGDEPDEAVARLAAEVARLHFFRGEPGRAMERVEQALAIAEAQRLPEVLSQALATKSLVIQHDRPREARALVREALDIAIEHDLLEATLRATNNLAVTEWQRDRPEEVRRLVADGFELARNRGHRPFLTGFAAWRCFFLLTDGRWDEAFALADEELPAQPTANATVATMHNWLAGAALDRGDAAEAHRRFDLVAPEFASSTDVQLRPIALIRDILKALAEHRFDDVVQPCRLVLEALGQLDPITLAAALRWTSRAAGAQELVPDLIELAKRYDVPEFQRTRFAVGQFCCGRGVIAARAGDHDAAVEAFAIGLAAARSVNDRWLTAELLTGFGESLVAAGRGDEAEPLLDEALELWDEMRATAWLERIAAARSQASVSA